VAAARHDGEVVTRRFVLRSVATFAGLLGTVIALTWVVLIVRTVLALGGGCAWVSTDEPDPACPPGLAGIGLTAVIGGIAALSLYVKAGLRVGPRLGLLAWPACFGPLFGAALLHTVRPGGGVTDYGSLWVVPELVLFVLGPLLVVPFRKGGLRETLWSDGRGLPGADDAPPSPPAEHRTKLWSAALQAATIPSAVWIGVVVYHATAVLPPGR
jgi:hypothetical protein